MDGVIGLLDAIPYLRAYADHTFVVKAGGDLLAKVAWRRSVAREVAVLHRLGIRIVFVHGGGPQLDAHLSNAGVAVERVAGRRITSPDVLKRAVRLWRGELSLSWVTALMDEGERAVGLSGADGGILRAIRRPPAVIDGQSVDFGEVGDLREVDTGILEALLGQGVIPVISPLALGSEGQVLNVNADTVAAHVAAALGAQKLILLTRAPGILADPADQRTALHQTTLEALTHLERAGALTGGMRPKVAAIRYALKAGVPRAHVVDGRREHALLAEVFTNEGSGTLVLPA